MESEIRKKMSVPLRQRGKKSQQPGGHEEKIALDKLIVFR